jgi:hypothetical protein
MHSSLYNLYTLMYPSYIHKNSLHPTLICSLQHHHEQTQYLMKGLPTPNVHLVYTLVFIPLQYPDTPYNHSIIPLHALVTTLYTLPIVPLIHSIIPLHALVTTLHILPIISLPNLRAPRIKGMILSMFWQGCLAIPAKFSSCGTYNSRHGTLFVHVCLPTALSSYMGKDLWEHKRQWTCNYYRFLCLSTVYQLLTILGYHIHF